MKQQPGVMLYFDVRDSIAQLTYEEKGMLLDAILDYGQKQQEPDFPERTLTLIWPFVRKDIHRDSERYEAMRAQRKAAVEKRWEKERAIRDDTSVSEPIREIPTTPPTTPPSPPSSPTAAAPSTAAAASETSSTAAPPLPRTNGSALPDIVARYLPGQRSTPEEVERRRADAIARLRALPDN